MQKKVFAILFIFMNSILFGVDVNSLNRYRWLEIYPNTIGGSTQFYKLEKIPFNYEIYKMKYNHRNTTFSNFFVFYYNTNNNKFYEVENINSGKSYIPLLNLNDIDNYEKISGDKKLLEGKYFSKTEKIEEIEIRKVEKKDYLYAIKLHYEESGLHLIYAEGEALISDNTFGLCKEEKLEKLFSVDRAESFYNNRNILSSYSNDNFTLNITKNEEFDIQLELKSDINNKYLIPKALFNNDCFYLYSGAKIYDNECNYIGIQTNFKEKVIVLEKQIKWIERDGFLNFLVKVQSENGLVYWVYSDSLFNF